MDLREVTAIVLAGDPKCLKSIPRLGVTFIMLVLKILYSLHFRKIIVVAHPDIPTLAPDFLRVTAGKSVFDSLQAGIAATETEQVLIVSSDLPFLDSSSLIGFLQKALSCDTEVCIPLASRSECEREPYRAIGGHRIALAGSFWKCGSVFFLRKSSWKRIQNSLELILHLRKEPIRLIFYFLVIRRLFITALRYGLSHLFPRVFLFLSLGFSDVQSLLFREIHVHCAPIVGGPELVIDYDESESH